jgi:putative two-component system response regulator
MFSHPTPYRPADVNEALLEKWGAAIIGSEAASRTASAASVEGEHCIAPASARLLIVDDEEINVAVLSAYLQDAGYQRITSFTDPVEALLSVDEAEFDVVFLDIMMPRISGLDLLGQFREMRRMHHVPMIVLTASVDRALKQQALRLGATDFLTKPFDPEELLARTGNALIRKAHFDMAQSRAAELERQVARRTMELVSSQLQLVQCLARAAEYRDNETGMHVIRVGWYAGLIARRLGLDEMMVRQIQLAATLHDVGKIGIPDAILLKAGPLEADEIQNMRRHARLGAEIMAPRDGSRKCHSVFSSGDAEQLLNSFESPLLRMAASIAATHHEHWNGGGYPAGLVGTDIPLEGRIVAIADVYDALSSPRPYKDSFTQERCQALLEEGRGKQFDPQILDAFLECLPEVERIRQEYADRGPGE